MRAIIVLSLLCAGCTGSLFDSDTPPNTNYVLAAAPAAAGAVTATKADVSIGRPDVAPGLDTQRIAVLRGRKLEYYRGAQWGGTTVEVVQRLLVDSLEDQGLFRSVTAEQARVSGDYVLDVEVRDFQAEYADHNGGGNDAPTVHVTMVGRLIRVVDRELVSTVAARAQNRAEDNRLSAVVAAFEQSAQSVAVELAQKVAGAIADDEESLQSRSGSPAK